MIVLYGLSYMTIMFISIASLKVGGRDVSVMKMLHTNTRT